MNRFKQSFLVKHPILGIVTLSAAVSVIWFFIILRGPDGRLADYLEAFMSITPLLFLLVTPVFVTLYNILYLVVPRQSETTKNRGRAVEYFTVIDGGLVTLFYAFIGEVLGDDIIWGSHWSDQLYNSLPLLPNMLPLSLCLLS